MYVSVRLTDGLGNRLFQVAAMLGYAERYGHTPVFVREWILENESHPSPYTITDYFPDIPVYATADSLPNNSAPWHTYTMNGDDCYTYVPLAPQMDKNVKLVGYFQSDRYFPTQLRPLPAALCAVPQFPYERTAFLHVRRGDYLSPYTAHHRVDLTAYFKRALSVLDSDTLILVCSDDMLWCMENLPSMYPEIDRKRWLWMRADATDLETLMAMARCRKGAICANSTFSWWGAYFAHKNGCPYVCMPAIWGYAPLPPARDIYPAFAHRVLTT